ncbi:hypothetical protein LCI18_009093 [Fusarium solani-melongenae]|uniref:Uncharacterized protein n=1 Tax=Fusarium solani subsp. cucurbitae TaxID=2747967 RepID=A0ACD3ZAR0_FUSSC|nr:hypothetical protein LCI18_009093 [Fusarium solani-melongenae]
MDRTSIDGRRRTKSATPSAKHPRKAETPVKLRPASPPKSNPWSVGNKRAAKPAADNFPPLPKPHMALSSVATSTTGRSRKSSTSSFEPQSRDEVALVTAPGSPSSNTSSTSRLILEAAASRATANLWKSPFGADVVVRAGTMEFRVHRNIVTPESGWFHDHLPPPNTDGTPVEIHMDLAPEAVGHCLRFIYTREIEICEYNYEDPWKTIHLPRCVLGYCAAVNLRVPKMISYLLRIVEDTSVQLGRVVRAEYLHRPLECSEWNQFSWYYQAALDILAWERSKKLVRPMRLALASVLDAILFWLMRQPLFVSVLQTTWHKVLRASVMDIAEYRQLTRDANPFTNSALPDELALRKMLDEVEEERKQFKKQAKKRRVFTENGLMLASGAELEGIRGRRGSM